jgi:hypothetical protein
MINTLLNKILEAVCEEGVSYSLHAAFYGVLFLSNFHRRAFDEGEDRTLQNRAMDAILQRFSDESSRLSDWDACVIMEL